MFLLEVRNLPLTVTNDHLSEIFGRVGEVKYAAVCKDLETGNSLGYGHVAYASLQTAEKAIVVLNNTELNGNKFVVQFDEPTYDEKFATVFVDNISHETTPMELLTEFSAFGMLVGMPDLTSHRDGSSKFASVRFFSPNAATTCIRELDGGLRGGRVWYVCRAIYVTSNGQNKCDSSNGLNTVLLEGVEVSGQIVWETFSKVGRIEVIKMCHGPPTGEANGKALVTFSKDKEASAAVRYSNNGVLRCSHKPIKAMIMHERETEIVPSEMPQTSSNAAASASGYGTGH